MAKSRTTDHFVVDGSNIATEGRSQPSLDQLNEAVLAFIDDHPGAVITVVVDATFGHRIANKEVKAFDEAVANNELVTPPAGAVGRGDAFVLTIADKAGAGVLSNDSFQEFHGEYDWLFDEGRLIGGKPVPHVGWVFVARTPVRGPKSRQAVRDAKSTKGVDATDAKQRANSRVRAKRTSDAVAPDSAEPAASGGRSGRGRSRRGKQAESGQQPSTAGTKRAPGSRGHVNELVPFLEFAERHPAGTSCTGVVESYASHGAYARVDDVLIYIPLRLMDSPSPRSARSVLEAGEAVAAVIVGYVADRRSIDAALPHMAEAALAEAAKSAEGSPDETRGPAEAPAETTPAKKAAKKTPAKKAAKKTPAKKAAKKTPAKKATKKTPAKKTAAKKTAAKPAAATKPSAEETPAEPTAAKQAPAKQAATKKAPAKQAAAKKAPAKKAPAKRAATKKTRAKQAPAKKAAKKTPAKKAATRKATAKKAPATEAGA